MERLMQAYDRRQIELLADYFSNQSYALKGQDTNWRLVELGRQLHRRYCRECHGDGSQQPDKGVPLLYGGWKDYLRWTIGDYLIGINHGDEEMSRQLTRLMRNHGQKGLEALIHYYAKAEP
jgi:mono/diheme cytochrome c family protein